MRSLPQVATCTMYIVSVEFAFYVVSGSWHRQDTPESLISSAQCMSACVLYFLCTALQRSTSVLRLPQQSFHSFIHSMSFLPHVRSEC